MGRAAGARPQGARGQGGNCFIEGTHYRAVHRLASALSGPDLGPLLAGSCARWLYSACLCFALPLAEQRRIGFQYQYSIWQLEYSRNYLFHQAQALEEVFQNSLDLSQGGELAATLRRRYGYMNRQLNASNIRKSPEGISKPSGGVRSAAQKLQQSVGEEHLQMCR